MQYGDVIIIKLGMCIRNIESSEGVREITISIRFLFVTVILSLVLAVMMVLPVVVGATPEDIHDIAQEMTSGLNQMKSGIGDAATPDTLLYGMDRCTQGLNQMKAGIGDTATPGTLLYATDWMLGLFQQMRNDYPGRFASPLDWCNAQVNAGGELYNLIYTWMPEPARAQALEALDTMGSEYTETKNSGQEAYDSVGDGSPGNTLSHATTVIQNGLNQIAAGIGDAATPETLLYGMDQCTQGLNQMKASIGDGAIPDTMLYGMYAIVAGLEEIISSGEVNTGDVQAMLQVANAISNGLNQMKAGIGDAATPDTLLYASDHMLGGLEALRYGFPNIVYPSLSWCEAQLTYGEDPYTLYGAVSNLMPEPQSSQALMIMDDMRLQSAGAKGASQEFHQSLGDGSTPGTFMYTTTIIQNGLNQIAAGIGDATTPDALLHGMNQCTQGLNQMKASIGDAAIPCTMLCGMNAIVAGLEELLQNTPVGEDVVVEPAEDVSLVFEQVITEGSTILNVQPDPGIENFTLLGSCYDISTTAVFSGPITITLPYDDTDLTLLEEQTLKMYHLEGGIWTDVTTGVNTEENLVTGVVSSLSPFVLGWTQKAAVIAYNGDYLARVTQSISLSTYLSETDGSPGEVGLAGEVIFEILDSQGALIRDVHAYITMVEGQWIAGAVTDPIAGANIYTVRTSLAANDYYTAEALETQLVVYDPERSFVTGGGYIGEGQAKKNFGFNAKYVGVDYVSPGGHLNFKDKEQGVHIKADQLDWLVIPGNENVAYMMGTCRLNGEEGYLFHLRVEDLSDLQLPDSLFITIIDDNEVVYQAEGTLSGGNIKIHR
jgi:hypothetical protein